MLNSKNIVYYLRFVSIFVYISFKMCTFEVLAISVSYLICKLIKKFYNKQFSNVTNILKIDKFSLVDFCLRSYMENTIFSVRLPLNENG